MKSMIFWYFVLQTLLWLAFWSVLLTWGANHG